MAGFDHGYFVPLVVAERTGHGNQLSAETPVVAQADSTTSTYHLGRRKRKEINQQFELKKSGEMPVFQPRVLGSRTRGDRESQHLNLGVLLLGSV